MKLWTKDDFLPRITDYAIAEEIIAGMQDSKTKQTFETFLAISKSTGDAVPENVDWIILRDRLAGWLVNNDLNQ